MFSTVVRLGCCWTWFCTWAWCCLRLQNIFLYEAIEITEHDGLSIILHQMVIRVCEMKNDLVATDKIQNAAVIMHVRSKVTICLYLIPNNRARSLSTLMAVNVNKNFPHKTKRKRKPNYLFLPFFLSVLAVEHPPSGWCFTDETENRMNQWITRLNHHNLRKAFQYLFIIPSSLILLSLIRAAAGCDLKIYFRMFDMC